MTLTTHAVVGATVATLVPNYPVLGFALGFGSHFILDAMPHWGYAVASMKKDAKNEMNNDMLINKDFYKDIIRIGIDGILGVLLSLIILGKFYHHSPVIILMGAIGGMTPDALQFVYWKWRHEPLISLQKFHLWIHTKMELNDTPVMGVLLQAILVCLIVVLLR